MLHRNPHGIERIIIFTADIPSPHPGLETFLVPFHQQAPHLDQIALLRRPLKNIKDEPHQNSPRCRVPIGISSSDFDQSLGHLPRITNRRIDVLFSDPGHFIEHVVGRAFNSGDFERVEDIDILPHSSDATTTLPSPCCSNPRQFSFGIDAEQRPLVEAQVRNERPGGFSTPCPGNGDHVFFSRNANGPQHPATDFEPGTPKENIAILKTAGQNFEDSGPSPCCLSSEACEDFPPTADKNDSPQDDGARTIDGGAERIPKPDEFQRPGNKRGPENPRENDDENHQCGICSLAKGVGCFPQDAVPDSEKKQNAGSQEPAADYSGNPAMEQSTTEAFNIVSRSGDIHDSEEQPHQENEKNNPAPHRCLMLITTSFGGN